MEAKQPCFNLFDFSKKIKAGNQSFSVILQGLKTVSFVSLLPMVESIRRDTKMPTGQSGISSLTIIIHPRETKSGLLRNICFL